MRTVNQVKGTKGIFVANDIIISLLFISISLLLLISSKQLPFSIYVPSMPFLDTVAFFIPIIFSLLLLAINENLKFDFVSLLLFFRILFSFLTIILNKVPFYSGMKSIIIFVTAFSSYTIWRNIAKEIDINKLKHFINYFILLLSIQTISIFSLSYFESSVVLKQFIEVPIGSSNFIAANLLIGIVFLQFNFKKSKFDVSIIFLGLVSLLLTYSFGAIISLFIILFIGFNVNEKEKTLIKQLFNVSMFIGLMFFLYNFFINYSPSQDNFLNNIFRNISMKLNQLQDGNIERLFSGRITLFNNSIDNLKKNPILGSYYGIDYNEQSNVMTHNLFLEALSSFGLLGFFTLFSSLSIVMFRMFNNIKKNNLLITPLFLALLSGIIHGFIEPNFFSLSFEFIWWTIAGFGMGKMQVY